MDFMQRDQKGYSDKEDQDQEQEDQEEEEDIITTSNSNYGSSPKYKGILLPPPPPHYHQQYGQQKPWLDVQNHGSPEAINFTDLSLNKDQVSDGGTDQNSWPPNSEREHMFDKVVTPSDVGKLNRLVIPKQHAERYFPLDSSSNDKGLLLNFQDRTGKPWRFRYSYWNSSQSYVMTKGWSRFVKEKKLDAGDIVSFERGVGESGKDRLYIDWRRRPPPPLPPQLHPHNHYGGGRLYSLLQPPLPSSVMSSMPLRHHEHFLHSNNNVHHPYHHQHHNYQLMNQQYLPHQLHQLQGGGDQHVIHHQYPMVIDSVPFYQYGNYKNSATSTSNSASASVASSAGKKLRLFGVNMECSSSPIEEDDHHECQILSSTAIPYQPHLPSSTSSLAFPPLEFIRLPNTSSSSTPPDHLFLSNKGKSTTSFYLDP
ncbi:unnamed protein product [Malus baccata var. baccata]